MCRFDPLVCRLSCRFAPLWSLWQAYLNEAGGVSYVSLPTWAWAPGWFDIYYRVVGCY